MNLGALSCHLAVSCLHERLPVGSGGAPVREESRRRMVLEPSRVGRPASVQDRVNMGYSVGEASLQLFPGPVS